MINLFKQKETDTYFVKVIKNPFFWISIILLIGPYLKYLLLYTSGVVTYKVTLWDYFFACHWFWIEPLNYLFNFPQILNLPWYLFDSKSNVYGLTTIFTMILGISQLSGLILSILNFKFGGNKDLFSWIFFVLFIISIFPALFIAMLIV